MTATAPIPAAEAPPMAQTPDNRPDQPAAEAMPTAAMATAPAAAEAKPRRWAILGDQPLLALVGFALAFAGSLLALVGTAAVGLLIFVLNDHGDRIGALDAKIEALDAKMEQRFAEQDAKIDALDAKIDAIDRKLTALIAALNKTEEVDAALEGRLLDSEPAG